MVKEKGFKHFEKELALDYLLKFELRGRSISCFVLKQGSSFDLLQFVFGWQSQGFHTTLSDAQEYSIFEALQSGLKDIPDQESLTVHFGSFSSDRDRQCQLQDLYELADTPELKFLMMGEKARVQELAGLGLRKPKFLRVYATYTVKGSTVAASDPLEKALAWLQKVALGLAGNDSKLEREQYEQLFARAFTDGFLNWEQILTTRMGLDLAPLSDADLWQELWGQFNSSPPPPIPQLLVMSEAGLVDRSMSQVHIAILNEL